MKTLNFPLDDSEYAELIKVKGKRSWRELLLSLLSDPQSKDEMKSKT